MADKNEMWIEIEADPRVIELAQSRGPAGGVSTAELRQFGYDVPDGTKYAMAAPKGGKNWRAVGNNGTPGFVYNDKPGVASKLITAGPTRVIVARIERHPFGRELVIAFEADDDVIETRFER